MDPIREPQKPRSGSGKSGSDLRKYVMPTPEHERNVEWILEQSALTNPYRRQEQNRKSEYYIYQMGFLASYLASLMAEDPFIARRYSKHIKDLQQRRPRKSNK